MKCFFYTYLKECFHLLVFYKYIKSFSNIITEKRIAIKIIKPYHFSPNQVRVKFYSSFRFVRGLFVIYGTFPRLIRRKHEQTTNKPHRKPEFHPTLTRRYGVNNSAYTEKFFSIISGAAFSSWIKLSGAKTCNRFLVDKDKTMPRTQNK